jgi:large subunit ribosomal protein L16
MLAPKHSKFYKSHYVSTLGQGSSTLLFGTQGIVASEGGQLTSQQLEAVRRLLTRWVKKSVWMRVFPDMSRTQKPKETRMGKGKGSVQTWYAPVKVNQLLFEFSLQDETFLSPLLKQVSSKLPISIQLKT